MIKSLLLILSITQIFSRLPSLNYDYYKENLEKMNNKQFGNLNFLQDLKYDQKEDQNLSFEQIVMKKGYPLSSYSIKSEDGYILKLFRITGPKNSSHGAEDKTKKVVLLQHGLMDSCDSWIANEEEKSLAFILANLGYDVWLGNNRGNKYSRSHLRFNPDKDKEFWDFSFHEMGIYDLPAMINHIKSVRDSSNEKKITYVGHSQGSAQLFAGITLLPDFFEENINGFIALGPVTNLENVNSPFVRSLVDWKITNVLKTFGFNEMMANSEAFSNLQKFLCSKFGFLCQGALQNLSDFSIIDDDMDRLLVFIAHFPSGSSLKAFLHFDQSIRYKNFASFGNMVPYDFSKAKKIPIALFVGKDDRLATVEDNRNLKKILEENQLLNFHREYENTGHISFFISKSNVFMNDLIEKVIEFSK